MNPASRSLVDLWVAELLGLPVSEVWKPGTNVGMHAGLGDFPAVVIIIRNDTIHVSLPGWADMRLVDQITAASPEQLRTKAFWKDNPHIHRAKVVAHESHSFSDTEVAEPGSIERIHASDIAFWADLIRHKQWEASGFGTDVPITFALRRHDEIAAVSGLLPFRGSPSDVISLTHPKFRGKGYTARVTRAAASYAVRHHGLARMRFDAGDQRMSMLAKSMGFEACFEQLVVRARD